MQIAMHEFSKSIFSEKCDQFSCWICPVSGNAKAKISANDILVYNVLPASDIGHLIHMSHTDYMIGLWCYI